MEREQNEKPWWNDPEKVAGALATILLCVVVAMAALVLVGLSIKIFTWAI